jgi:hypothetical protein
MKVNVPRTVAASEYVPEAGSVPGQLPGPLWSPPEFWQPDAFVEDHVRLSVCPICRLLAEAVSVAVGGGGVPGVTVSVTCAVALGAPGATLWQERPKVYVPGVSETTAAEPLGGIIACTSCQSNSGGGVPVPMQAPALVVDQETLNVCPTATVAGETDIVAVAAGGASTVTVTGCDVTAPTTVW